MAILRYLTVHRRDYLSRLSLVNPGGELTIEETAELMSVHIDTYVKHFLNNEINGIMDINKLGKMLVSLGWRRTEETQDLFDSEELM